MNFIRFAVATLLATSACLKAAEFVVAQGDPRAADTGPGTTEQPWKTVAKAAEAVRAGDTVVIRDGTYRERVVLKSSGTRAQPIRFQSAPGAHVVLTGADRLTAWQKTDPDQAIYQTSWTHRFNTWSPHMTHPDDDYHRLPGRCEQVIIEGYLLRQVLGAAQLAPGTFFVDLTNQMLRVWDYGGRDLNKVLVEASTRQEIFRVEGDYVELHGLRFRYAANAAQHGAVVLAGHHDVLEDCLIEHMNSSGATFSGEDAVVRRCAFLENGQLGFGANGAHRLLFTDCLVEGNNTKAFDRGWEAGGNKLVLCRDALLEQSRFLRNRGNGLWFDIGNEHCTVTGCLIADNEDSGIFYEISFGLQAHDNVIVGNGFASTPGAWGAQAGIAISSSPQCVIERNLIVGNREGFNFREQTRSTPRIGKREPVPVWNHDELIRHNIIALNRDAQIWGWFDVKDGRQWPAAQRDATATGEGQPGLSLEQLRLSFVENIYFAGPGQGWFEWGATWRRHRSYPDLSSFRGELHIDHESRVFDPAFADVSARDFRVSVDAMKKIAGSYPQGQVPDVDLGVRQ